MRTLQEKYNAVLEDNYSKAQFVKDANTQFPNLVSRVNSFEDASGILKNRGMIAEAKKMQEPKYSTAKPEDTIAPDVLDTGIKFELDKKYGTLDVTDEQYAKCREMAIKNLAKDVLYYVKQDSIQLETPGEKMEKVTLKEEISEEEAWKEYQEKRHVTAQTIAAAEKDFNKGWKEGKYRDGNYMSEEVDPKATVAKMIPIIQDYLANGGDRGAAKDVMDDLKNGRNLHVYADIESVEDLKDQLDYEHSYSDDLSDLEEDFPGENPKKYKDSDTFDPTKFYIKDLKSGRILNAVSVQGSKLISYYDTETDAQAQADWITRWEGDPGRFVVLSGDEAEDQVNKQTGTGEKEKSFFEKRLDKMRAQQDLKEEQQLKELFKKIITKVITE